ncbi:DUF2147 domain-containing protein [Sandarakinorhabdus glacialis]|nr:DUF2147 domain-containing protein [Polymorphobacter glacialis]
MKMRLGIIALGLLAGSAMAQSPANSPANSPDPAAAVARLPDGAYLGTWQNPSGSVHIRAARCGKLVCGTIVYADEKARGDARRGGTDPLVGTQLFEEFTARGPREWRGRVFVPDMNRRVTGTARLLEDGNSIRVEGCAAQVICRNQVWTRIRG